MKFTALLLVPFVVEAGVLRETVAQGAENRPKSIYPRQGGFLSTTASLLLSAAKPAKVEDATPKIQRKGVVRQRLFYGPYKLRPANEKKPWNPAQMDPNSETWNYIAKGLPQGATLLFQNTTLQYEDGSPATQATGVYNHHVAFINTNKFAPQFSQCPAGSAQPLPAVPSTIMGASEEIGTSFYTTPDGKFDSGYYIGKDDKVLMSGEVVNYSNEAKSIYVVSDLEYIPGQPEGFLDVIVQLINVVQCDTASLMLRPPPGQKKFAFESKNMTVLKDGYILSRRGHLHDGGASIDFKVNGKVICLSEALYTGPGLALKEGEPAWQTVSGTSECHDPVKVVKGDIVSVTAKYDLEKHPARAHVGGGGMAEEMGVMSFNFAS